MNNDAFTNIEQQLQARATGTYRNESPGQTLPTVRPMELWAFLENSDFVRYKSAV